MLPFLVALAGVALLLAGLALVRGFGARYRVARLLAAAPEVSVAEAVSLARGGSVRYVRVQGRITSEEEFPDEQDRPLVYRRARLELARPDGGWRVVHEEREAVPFGLADRSAFIALDIEELSEGLVVLPREATGVGADIPRHLPPDADPAMPARQRVDQVSAVEHAHAAGVPTLDAHGQPRLSAGLGRPLVLTTLERAEAMRVLADGRSGRLRVAALLLALGGSLLLASGLLALMQAA